MAGTVVASTINNDTGLFSTNNAYLGIAKACVNFAGSTGTINGSFNFNDGLTQSAQGDDLGTLNKFSVDTWFKLKSLPSNNTYPQIITNIYDGGLNPFINYSIGLINGVNRVFLLLFEPVKNSEHLYLNGLLQDSDVGTDYIIVGNKITFYDAPMPGDKIRCSYTMSKKTKVNYA
jgi:hypothetical protein